MKKIILVILSSIFALLAVGSVEAAEYTIVEEIYEYQPADESFTINGSNPDAVNYSSVGYVSLLMGYGNSFTFEIASRLQELEYFQDNLENVSSIYLQIQVGTYYTSAANGYWNTSSTAIDIDGGIITHAIDPEYIPQSVSFVIWWANEGYSGGAPYSDTGGLRYYEANLVVEYETPVDTIIDVDSDYTLLPDCFSIGLNGLAVTRFHQIESLQLYDAASRSYHLSFSTVNQEGEAESYRFDVAFPVDLDLSEVIIDDWNVNMSYSTSPDGDRILYVQPDPEKLPYPDVYAASSDSYEEYNIGFTVINLTQGEYSRIEPLSLQGVVNKESSNHAFLYCFFPLVIENLLKITVRYDYNYQFLFFKGETRTAVSTFAHGDSYEADAPGWLWWIPVVGWGVVAGSAIRGNDIYDIEDVVEPIEAEDVPDTVAGDFMVSQELTNLNLQSYELYKVHLGQFQEGLNTSYDIQRLVIIYIMYEYQGVIYEAASEAIESEVATPDPEVGWTIPEILDGLDDALESGRSFLIVVCVSGAVGLSAVLGIKLVNRIKRSGRKRKFYK